MKEPYEIIRKRQTAKALAEVEQIKDIPSVQLGLIKDIIKKRIEWTLKDAEAEAGDGE
jgi:hypothetical protein